VKASGTSRISERIAYATNNINAVINLGLHVHSSEPNDVWAEGWPGVQHDWN